MLRELQAPKVAGVYDTDDRAHPHTELDLGQQVSAAHKIYHLVASLCAHIWMLMGGPCQKEHHLRTLINHGEVDRQNVYHSGTRLPDGRPSLFIDPGSVANLCGDKWAQECAKIALQHGLTPSQSKRTRPLSVMGVGTGSQTCTHNCTLLG